MEKLSEIISRNQLATQNELPQLLTDGKEDSSYSMSVYSDKLTPNVMLAETKKLQAAFPSISSDQVNVLSERIIANGFTDNRLKDAISNLIDNHRYPNIMISDVISFDKRIKLYSHSDICGLLDKGQKWSEFVKFKKINNKIYFAKIQDAEMYGLKSEIE